MATESPNLKKLEIKKSPENVIDLGLVEARIKLENDKFWALVLEYVGMTTLTLGAAMLTTDLIKFFQDNHLDQSLLVGSNVLILLGTTAFNIGRKDVEKALAKIKSLREKNQ